MLDDIRWFQGQCWSLLECRWLIQRCWHQNIVESSLAQDPSSCQRAGGRILKSNIVVNTCKDIQPSWQSCTLVWQRIRTPIWINLDVCLPLNICSSDPSLRNDSWFELFQTCWCHTVSPAGPLPQLLRKWKWGVAKPSTVQLLHIHFSYCRTKTASQPASGRRIKHSHLLSSLMHQEYVSFDMMLHKWIGQQLRGLSGQTMIYWIYRDMGTWLMLNYMRTCCSAVSKLSLSGLAFYELKYDASCLSASIKEGLLLTFVTYDQWRTNQSLIFLGSFLLLFFFKLQLKSYSEQRTAVSSHRRTYRDLS